MSHSNKLPWLNAKLIVVQWRIVRGKLNQYPLYLVQNQLSVAINIHNCCFLDATFSLLFVGVAEICHWKCETYKSPLTR